MGDISGEIEAALSALDAQRGTLGDAVVDMATRALLERLGPDVDTANHPRLRQATVLFVDVVGSTAIGSALDPEDVYAVMDRIAFDFTRIVARWFGQVVKYTGDGLLAAFGVDSGQEQAAEHAIRAGLEMLAELPAIRSVFAVRLAGRPLDARVGVHTGRVLIGGGVEGTSNIRGSTVNLAARMEQHAPAGGLRISHDTYRHARGLFDVVSEPPITVQGLDEPVQTYLVSRARPNAFRAPTRGIDGVETRMIGRGTELAALQESFGAATAGEARWHLVVADAGLGKSRLLHELRYWAETRGTPFHLLAGRAQLISRAEPFGLLRDLFTGWIRRSVAADEPPSAGAFHRAVEPLVGETTTQLLEHALGLDISGRSHLAALSTDPRHLRHRVVRAVSRLISELAVHEIPRGPVVLLLEDLHWADDGTLDVLEHLARVNPDIPLLVIATTRPELLDRRPGLAAPVRGRPVRTDLGPLDEAHADELVGALLQNLDVVPPDLRRRIVVAGDGVPFFLEEAVRMLLDEGAIRADQTGWHLVDDRLALSRVPDTLAGVLQARLDALSPDELAAAQRASVIGHLFWSEGSPLSAADSRRSTDSWRAGSSSPSHTVRCRLSTSSPSGITCCISSSTTRCSNRTGGPTTVRRQTGWRRRRPACRTTWPSLPNITSVQAPPARRCRGFSAPPKRRLAGRPGGSRMNSPVGHSLSSPRPTRPDGGGCCPSASVCSPSGTTVCATMPISPNWPRWPMCWIVTSCVPRLPADSRRRWSIVVTTPMRSSPATGRSVGWARPVTKNCSPEPTCN